MNLLPNEFVASIQAQLGEEAPQFFDALNGKPALALRINALKPAAAAAAAEFCGQRVPWAENGYYLSDNARPGASIAHAAGAFYLQEASAMVSAAILDAQPGERVLDLCAAPGGKSTQLASSLQGAGLLVSNEPEPARAKVLASNLERMGVVNALVVNAYPDSLAARWPEYFDAVLVDAPCSGEGMFRRDPETRTQWTPAAPMGCAKRQAEILDAAAKLLRPGGRLVYSTCTFNRHENEESIRGFLNRHPEFAPEEFSLEGIGASLNGCIRVWPHRVRGDGHFAARLRKAGSADTRQLVPAKNAREDLALLSKLEEEVCALPKWVQNARLMRFRDTLFAVNPQLDTAGVRVVCPGLRLLRIGKNYIEPDHSLALALQSGAARRTMDLDAETARAYLAGEAVRGTGEKGWVLVTYQSLPLGWGKRSDDILKNHYPKGLRRAGGAR